MNMRRLTRKTAAGIFMAGAIAVMFGNQAVTAQTATAEDPRIAQFRAKANAGDVVAQWSLGVLYENGTGVSRDYAQAAQWYRKAAEQNHAPSQTKLGSLYAKGLGVPREDAQAVQWYRKAAEQGDALAEANLGALYATGDGVPQDHAQALQWFRKAAEKGNGPAQFNLGLLIARGQGTPKDYLEAEKWLILAAERVPSEMRNDIVMARDTVAKVLSPAELADAQRRAREWAEAFGKKK